MNRILLSTIPAIEAERRGKRLADCIARMAAAIAAGECIPPSQVELDAIAALCDEYHLYAEAARVRRWMAQ